MSNSVNLNKINEVRKEFMGEHYKEWKEDDLKRFLNQPQTRLLTMEYEEGGAVNMAVINIVESFTRKSLVIEDFIVDKEWRGIGWGTKLLDKIIELARKINADCIEVATKSDNEAANKLYQRAGFKDRNNTSYRLWIKQQ